MRLEYQNSNAVLHIPIIMAESVRTFSELKSNVAAISLLRAMFCSVEQPTLKEAKYFVQKITAYKIDATYTLPTERAGLVNYYVFIVPTTSK